LCRLDPGKLVLEKRHVAVVADPYTVYAFRLIGAEGYTAVTPREVEEALREIAAREDIGLVLVSAELYDDSENTIERLLRERGDLVVARLPTVREPGQPMDVQKELMRALGMG
jgi:V/A-type H+-transporting ATPase subunit F